MIIDPLDPRQVLLERGMLTNVHLPARCAGEHCVVHNPSSHHMRAWPLVWRDDLGLFERTCSHGIGHPDPDQVDFLIKSGQEALAVHGCCGCCSG